MRVELQCLLQVILGALPVGSVLFPNESSYPIDLCRHLSALRRAAARHIEKVDVHFRNSVLVQEQAGNSKTQTCPYRLRIKCHGLLEILRGIGQVHMPVGLNASINPGLSVVVAGGHARDYRHIQENQAYQYPTAFGGSQSGLLIRSIIAAMGDSRSSYGRSGPGTPLEQNHAYLRLHSVDIFVKDQERSLRFYLDQLGFDLAFDARLQSGQRLVGVSPPEGTAVLTLIQPAPDSAEYNLIGRATRVVFVTEDVIGKYREWSDRGVRFRYTPRLRRIRYQEQMPGEQHGDVSVHFGEQEPIWGQVFTRFEDIDRNVFGLVSLDEVSKAIEAQRRANAERLEAQRRIAYELDIARQVQARLFPQRPPPCSTLEFAGICAQARQVGGDYYDFLPLGPKQVGLVIGDVAGKGMAAALLMANLQAHLRSQCAMTRDEPDKLLRSVNQLFYENTTPSVYATLIFAEYNDELQALRYVNCGHLCGLVLRGDGAVERLGSTGTVLGLFTDWDCSIGECRLFNGDILALYTDGVTESFNEEGEEFGEERILLSLKRHRDLSPEGIVQAILADVQHFGLQEQHDDITLIAAKCRGQGAAG